MIYTNINYLH